MRAVCVSFFKAIVGVWAVYVHAYGMIDAHAHVHVHVAVGCTHTHTTLLLAMMDDDPLKHAVSSHKVTQAQRKQHGTNMRDTGADHINMPTCN